MMQNPQAKKIKPASESQLTPELLEVMQSIVTVNLLVAKMTLTYQQRDNLVEQDLALLTTVLENIRTEYKKTFNVIEKHGLAEHLLVKEFYKDIIRVHQQFFELLHNSIANSDFPITNTFLRTRYPELISEIYAILQPCGTLTSIKKCCQMATVLADMLIFANEITPVMNNLSRVMQKLADITSQKRLQDADIDMIVQALQNMGKYYQLIWTKLNQHKLVEHHCAREFYTLLETNHQVLFYNLVASLETIQFFKHEVFFKTKLPNLLTTLNTILKNMTSELPLLRKGCEIVTKISENFAGFLVIQELNAMNAYFYQRAQAASETREQVLAMIKEYFALLLPKCQALTQAAPNLTHNYPAKIAAIYTAENLAVVYAKEASTQRRLQSIREDTEIILQLIKTNYADVPDSHNFITHALRPFIISRDEQLKLQALAEKQQQQAQAIAKLIRDTHQVITATITQLDQAAQKKLIILQQGFNTIFTTYKQALTACENKQDTPELKPLSQYPLAAVMLSYIEENDMSLTKRMDAAVDMRNWLLRERKKYKALETHFNFNSLLTVLKEQLKLYRHAEAFIKQAVNLAIIKSQKHRGRDREALRKKFILSLTQNHAERLTICLLLVKQFTQFDEQTRQQLRVIFECLHRSLILPADGAPQENLLELKSQLDLLLNKPLPRPARLSWVNSIKPKQNPVDLTGSPDKTQHQPNNNTYFSFFSTPIELHFMKFGWPVHTNEQSLPDRLNI
ncbi:MAG: hypothetical protein K0S11_1346 [Gammaproteobacteria bacterium]|jgi:hypothetical protein|nr:hypothetical protein [Gammaproteobacteria bacterium]